MAAQLDVGDLLARALWSPHPRGEPIAGSAASRLPTMDRTGASHRLRRSPPLLGTPQKRADPLRQFLDPPFDGGLLAPALRGLAQGRVAPGERVYIEHGAAEALPELDVYP